jgi:hypothetical protein
MTRWIRQSLMLPVGMALLGAALYPGAAGAASDHCFYKGTMFSDGAMFCQTGAQFRCKNGDWKSTGSPCTSEDSPRVSRTCALSGISYSTGSASCQDGTQYRCEDGTWRSLGTACTVGDAPIRAVPSGRTCLYEGATVSTNSTICKSGQTFLCSDGEWVNLGTQCR